MGFADAAESVKRKGVWKAGVSESGKGVALLPQCPPPPFSKPAFCSGVASVWCFAFHSS